MREIKFRAWDEEFGGMYPVTTLQFHACGQINAWAFYPDAVKPKARTYGHNPILMQYTGLKDKNGKEIYEGDIVSRRGNKLLCEVYFEELDLSYRLACHGDRQFDKTYPLRFADTIIGNIYETPELLNV